MSAVLDRIERLLATNGQRPYGLHDVSQLEHALQTALLAEQAGAGTGLIAAALLHDVGHLTAELGEDPAAGGIDDRHEEHGATWLAAWFGPEVTEPVRLHVAAKRYLCATEPDYAAALAPDSVLSLRLQGGPMKATEAIAFRALPHAAAALRLRRFDEAAKVPGLAAPGLSHFMTYVTVCLLPGD